MNLIDIMMPNMNGYELLETLRSNVKTRMIPIILLSAKASETSKIQGSLNTIKLSVIIFRFLIFFQYIYFQVLIKEQMII